MWMKIGSATTESNPILQISLTLVAKKGRLYIVYIYSFFMVLYDYFIFMCIEIFPNRSWIDTRFST
jgi:hypothetical protein